MDATGIEERAERPARRAIVLSGGGARGAYEAGVLNYLLDELPLRLGGPVRLDLISGTSVGAIHACYLAATAHENAHRGQNLVALWNDMELSALFGSSALEMMRLPMRMLSMLRASELDKHEVLPDRLQGLLDTSGLEDLVRRAIPWTALRSNVAAGRVDAVCVAATEVASGRVVVFVESQHPRLLRWTRDPSVVARPVRIGLEHALASAAIPGLFPAVRIDQAYYSDGGLRLNTPLSPVLRLGADRVLVIALRNGEALEEPSLLQTTRHTYAASPIFLLGKAMNALMLDHIDRDLRQMRLLNDLLLRARQIGGSEFVDRLNETVEHDRGQPFKIVDDLVIRPSADLSVLASEAAHRVHDRRDTSQGIRLALRALGFIGNPFEADLLSYLFFDRSYTQTLLELGLADARRAEESLIGFFTD